MQNKKGHIIICTTSDISTDRRMQRIADSLIQANYHIQWIGRNLQDLDIDKKYHASIIKTTFKSGVLFYGEYNLRLLLRLLSKARKGRIINAVDLDTALAVKLVSKLKSSKMVFDSHEYFEEVPELNGKRFVKTVWRAVGRIAIKNSKWNYTVNHSLAKIFAAQYGQTFEVIKNTPPSRKSASSARVNNKIIAYVGVLNKGRGLETAIKAMQQLEGYQLWMIGDGDIRNELEQLAAKLEVKDQVRFKGWTAPKDLNAMLDQCSIGLNLLDDISESYRLSLANKCFDYIHMSLPAIHMNFPEYRQINDKYQIGVLINELDAGQLSTAIKSMESGDLYNSIISNCQAAAQEYNWEQESKKLLAFYQQLQ